MRSDLLPDAPQHRFDLPIGQSLSYRDRVELQYASSLIPYLKTLEQTVGREKVIESLRTFSDRGVRQFAEQVVREKGKNDLSVFKEIFSPSNPGLWSILTVDILKDTEEAFEIRVYECLLAEVFRSAGAEAYGSALLCRDVLFTHLVNPEIKLHLDGTLMVGKPCCTYRWCVKR